MVEMALDISTMIKASWDTVEEKTPMFLNHNWKASRVKGENLKNRNKTRRRNQRRKRRREKRKGRWKEEGGRGGGEILSRNLGVSGGQRDPGNRPK